MSVLPWEPFKWEKEEAEAIRCFNELASQYRNNFKEVIPQEYGHPWDVTTTDIRGREAHIELKVRNAYADRFPDCFIEFEKWRNMITNFRATNAVPLYINFIGDGSEAYIFNLSDLKGGSFHPNVTISGVVQDRIGLDWNEAIHVRRNNEGKYIIVNGK